MIKQSAAFLGKNGGCNTAAKSWKWVSTEHGQLLALHLGRSKGRVATSTHNRSIGIFSRQKWLRQHRCYVQRMSVNGASMIVDLASCILKGLSDDMNPNLSYRPPFWAKMRLMTSWLCPKNEHPWSLNNCRPCIFGNIRAVWPHSSIIELSATFPGKNACDNIVTMSWISVHRASTERQQSINRASTECQQSVNRASTERQQSVNRASTDRLQIVNDFCPCILHNPRAMERS